MSHGHFHIPMEEIMAIEVKLADKVELQTLIKQFIYDESKDMNQNLKQLGEKLQKYLYISPRTYGTLANFLVQKNIPIEVNFKPLKIEQLVSILEQWLSMHTESSTILQKLYTNKHRNIHFRKILFDQRQTINDYFQTLSDKKMLKAVNLYQLLVQILSNSFLYEFKTDAQTFFEKINSFNTFVDIVNKFIHSQKRISLVSNKEDFEYIQRIEFQRLIQFWQEQNSQLELLTQKRFNITSISVQTNLINVHKTGVQTEQNKNLSNFINNVLFTLNKFTSFTDNVKQLASIERIYSLLRREKMYLLGEIDSPPSLRNQQKYNGESYILRENNQNPVYLRSVDQSKTVEKVLQKESLIDELKFKEQLDMARTNSPNRKLNNVIQTIYDHYQQIEGFSQTILEKFLVDSGISQDHPKKIIDKLINRRMIRDKSNINENQFKEIMRYLMQIDKELTIEVLEEFMKYRKTFKFVVKTPKVKSCLESPRSRFESSFMLNSRRNYMSKYIDRSYF